MGTCQPRKAVSRARDDWDPCPMMKPLKEEPGLAGVGQGRTVGFGVSFWCLEASSPHSPGPQGL